MSRVWRRLTKLLLGDDPWPARFESLRAAQLILRAGEVGVGFVDDRFVDRQLFFSRLTLEPHKVGAGRLDRGFAHSQIRLKLAVVELKQRVAGLHLVVNFDVNLDDEARHRGADFDVLRLSLDDAGPCDGLLVRTPRRLNGRADFLFFAAGADHLADGKADQRQGDQRQNVFNEHGAGRSAFWPRGTASGCTARGDKGYQHTISTCSLSVGRLRLLSAIMVVPVSVSTAPRQYVPGGPGTSCSVGRDCLSFLLDAFNVPIVHVRDAIAEGEHTVVMRDHDHRAVALHGHVAQ